MVEIVGGEDDRQMGPVFAQQLRDVNPVQMRQHDVQHQDVRAELADARRNFAADSHNLDVVLTTQGGVVVFAPATVIHDKKHSHDK